MLQHCCNIVATFCCNILLQHCCNILLQHFVATLLQHCCNIVATFCCNILLQHFVATFCCNILRYSCILMGYSFVLVHCRRLHTGECLNFFGSDGGDLGGEGRRGSSVLFFPIKLLHQEMNARKRILVYMFTP